MKRIKQPISLRQVRKQEPAVAHTALALAIGMGVTSAAMANSDENVSKLNEKETMEIVEVYGVAGAPYKALRSGDMRRAADLAESPNTMTILTQTQILDSGRTDLKEILASQAGITLGTGENGNAFGDRYIIRGHEARSDVFVDGVRDPGMTTRESFATEQIEITKGPSSTFAGRGSSGGAVNGITKQASLDHQFSVLNASGGTDDMHRFTLDFNNPFTEQVAVRANLLYGDEDIPNRSPASRKRVGGLISALWQATSDLQFIVDYYHLDAEDVPDLGSYFDQTSRAPTPDIPVYLQDGDFLDTEVNTFTLKTTYDINESLVVQNSTRYGQTDNGYVTTGARGTNRDASDPFAPGAATFSLSTHQGWQEIEYFVNQTNLFWDTELFGTSNQIVAGFEYSTEDVQNGVYETNNTGASNCVVSGRGGAGPGYCGLDANGALVSNISTLLGRTSTRGGQDSNFDVETFSAYMMDTIEFSSGWTGFFGVRYDRFDYNNQVLSRGNLTSYDYSDGFWNGHAGIVRAIGENGNVYVTYSTATNINGGESDVGGSCGYGGLCGTPDQVDRSDPEQVNNIEIGTKWEFLDKRLLATAAIFRVTKSDVMESVGDAYSSIGTLNTGKNRVEGIEVSLTGALTDKLSVQFSAAFMDSEVLKSFVTANEGRELSNFADDSIYVQLRYEPTDKLAFGGAYTYKSEMYGGQPDTAAGFNTAINDYSIVVPSYDVVDLFVNYSFSEAVSLRLNVRNITDEEYWTAAYRSGSFMYLGDARSVQGTLTWRF